MPRAEIALVLGVAPPAAEAMLRRARDALLADVAALAGRRVPWSSVATAYRARLGVVAAPWSPEEALALVRA